MKKMEHKLHKKEEKLHHKAEKAMKSDEKVHEKIEKLEKKMDKPKKHHSKHKKHSKHHGHHKKKHESAMKKAMHHPDKLGAGAKKRKHLKPKDKIAVVMKEFDRGTLNSSSGQKVTNPRQALAIGYSEARRAAKKKKK